MKKLVLSALALIGFVSFSIAQTTPAKTTKAPAKPKMEVAKKDAATAKPVKTPAAKPAKVTTAKPAATTTAKPATAAGPTKKDGTLDKRFKANKTAPAGPLKKDGTPDKRYKANKS